MKSSSTRTDVWQLIESNYVVGVGLRAADRYDVHPEIWARDAFISEYFLLNSPLMDNTSKKRKIEEIVVATIETFLKFTKDNRVPLRIEDSRFSHVQAIISNVWYSIPVLNRLPLVKKPLVKWNFDRAIFKSSQMFADYAVDPGLWLIVVVDELNRRFLKKKYWKKWSRKLKEILDSYYKRGEIKECLLIEGQLASWMDSYRFPGGMAMSYTNLIFLKCLEIFKNEGLEWRRRYKESKKAILGRLIKNDLFCLGLYKGSLIEAVNSDANLMACWWFWDRNQTSRVLNQFKNASMFDMPVRAIMGDSWRLRFHGMANFLNIYHLTNSWPWLAGWGILAARKHKLVKYERIISDNLVRVCEINQGFPETVDPNGKLVTFGPFKLSNKLTWTAAAVSLVK